MLDPRPPTRLLLACLVCLGLLTAATHAQPYDPARRSLSVMSWNVEWMFDDDPADNRSPLAKEQSAPSTQAWKGKLAAVAEVIAGARVDVVGLQEIEGAQTLSELAAQLKSAHHQSFRCAFIQGSDSFTEQDVGFLVRGGMIAYSRQEQSKAMFDSGEFHNLSKHLFAEFRWSNVDSPLTLLNVHLRATDSAAPLRLRQARLARHWLEPRLAAGEDVILLGDLNSEVPPGENAGEIAALVGRVPMPRMVDLLTRLDNPREATHLIIDKQFDRILVSPSMLEDGPGLDWNFESIRLLPEAVIRGARDGAEHWERRLTDPGADLDVSDHIPVVAQFKLQ